MGSDEGLSVGSSRRWELEVGSAMEDGEVEDVGGACAPVTGWLFRGSRGRRGTA